MQDVSKARLLVVDDEAAHMKALCETLEPEGFQITGFTSASKALAALREQDFDLLLTDLMMPEMDGVALLRTALEVEPNLVAIIMTGYGTIDTAVAAMKAGAFDYILKPFRLSAIRPVLTRALAIRRLRVENIQLYETAGIYELSMAIAFAPDSKTILQKVADAAFEHCRARTVSVLSPADDGRQLSVVLARGENAEQLLHKHVPISDPLKEWLVRSRESLAKPEDYVKDQHANIVAHFFPGIAPGLAIPILSGGKLVNVLIFTPAHAHRPYSIGQIKALTILVNVAASALERQMAEAELRESQERLALAIEATQLGTFDSFPLNGKLILSERAKSHFGVGAGEQVSYQSLVRRIHPDDRKRVEETMRNVRQPGAAGHLEAEYRTIGLEDGIERWLAAWGRVLFDSAGEPVRLVGVTLDITARKHIEENLIKSMRQKVALLQEVHHRVRNNLQIISSLLSMQASTIDHEPTVDKLRASEDRITAMAMIHEQLYRNDEVSSIDLAEHLRNLTTRLFSSYARSDAISYSLALAPTQLTLEQSIPCGLILNELVTNALKYAYPGGKGEIAISLSSESDIVSLKVSDQGPGMPAGFDWQVSKSLGMTIIHLLTKQLDGHLEIGPPPGASFSLHFTRQPHGDSLDPVA